jgi:monothiol glutaredoxin
MRVRNAPSAVRGELDTFFADNGVNFDKEAAEKIREANA